MRAPQRARNGIATTTRIVLSDVVCLGSLLRRIVPIKRANEPEKVLGPRGASVEWLACPNPNNRENAGIIVDFSCFAGARTRCEAGAQQQSNGIVISLNSRHVRAGAWRFETSGPTPHGGAAPQVPDARAWRRRY
jgi:hypothetical protein